VEAVFARNPKSATSFHSINGPIDITFQPGLAADLRFKTMHGEVYTDFDVMTQPVTEQDRAGWRFHYRSTPFPMRAGSVRIGTGGPELSFETLNGTIYIRRAK
jgi:hypothetical protein